MEEKRLSQEEFFLRAIRSLRDPSKSLGIHFVYSGLNSAFRKYFHEDPVLAMKELKSQGKIEIRPRKGGVMIYLPGEAPRDRTDRGEQALFSILRGEPASPETRIREVIKEILPQRSVDETS
jgi:hypothetical protein